MTMTVEVLSSRKKKCFSIFFQCAYYRGSHRTCSGKKGVLNNFTLFTGKHMCWRFQQACFAENIANLLRTLILKNICERLLLLPKPWLYCFLDLFSFKYTKHSSIQNFSISQLHMQSRQQELKNMVAFHIIVMSL